MAPMLPEPLVAESPLAEPRVDPVALAPSVVRAAPPSLPARGVVGPGGPLLPAGRADGVHLRRGVAPRVSRPGPIRSIDLPLGGRARWGLSPGLLALWMAGAPAVADPAPSTSPIDAAEPSEAATPSPASTGPASHHTPPPSGPLPGADAPPSAPTAAVSPTVPWAVGCWHLTVASPGPGLPDRSGRLELASVEVPPVGSLALAGHDLALTHALVEGSQLTVVAQREDHTTTLRGQATVTGAEGWLFGAPRPLHWTATRCAVP